MLVMETSERSNMQRMSQSCRSALFLDTKANSCFMSYAIKRTREEDSSAVFNY